jgi:hypothetical protein
MREEAIAESEAAIPAFSPSEIRPTASGARGDPRCDDCHPCRHARCTHRIARGRQIGCANKCPGRIRRQAEHGHGDDRSEQSRERSSYAQSEHGHVPPGRLDPST